MLIVTGLVEVDEAGADQARKAAQEMVDATLQEPGCLIYEFSQVLGYSNRFRVYEEWQDQAALDAHFATPHMATFRAAMAEAGLTSRELYRVVGGQKQPLD